MKLTLVNLLQILISSQGLFFFVFLVTRRTGKRLSNRVLATFLILLAAQMVAMLLQDQGILRQGIAVPQLFALLYGPLLYLYVRGLIYRDLSLTSGEALHLAPFLVALTARALSSLTPGGLALAIFVSMGSYLALALLALGRYRRILRGTRSRTEGITLSWLSGVLIGVSVLVALDVASFSVSASALPALEAVVGPSVFAGLLVSVNALVFKGLRHPELFGGITAEEEAIAREQGRSPDRSAALLSEADADRLRRCMEREKPYLEPDLTLAGLAETLSMPPRRLSRLINRHFGQNFSDFVNTYRVEEAKTRLAGPAGDAETVLDMLYAVGFNSKSSFNAAFKRRTGATPTEYRKRYRR